ncbi:MAG: tripartite tricarboxylate transporter TctB family protein [Thermodesulfobacteriota bacterium]
MDKGDIVAAAGWLLLSAFAFAASLELGVGEARNPGAGFLPFWASAGLALSAGLLPLSAVWREKGSPQGTRAREKAPRTSRRRNSPIAVAALVLYCVALPLLGYLLSTFALMLVLFGLGETSPRTVVIGSLITALSSYGLFAIALGTPLPGGVLGF